MPGGSCYGLYRVRRRTWKTLSRHARKSWYREEEARIARGHKTRQKP